MKENSCMIFVDILLLIGVVYLLFSCSNRTRKVYTNGNETNAPYSINHYVDTINGHIILTTVCNSDDYHISVSTLKLN